MMRFVGFAGMASLGLALALAGAANAQTVHRHHARHMAVVDASAAHAHARAGRQITVHARESWLTAGTMASPGEFNSYASWTVTPMNRPVVEFTFVGMRGLERLPNNFTVPGCCVP